MANLVAQPTLNPTRKLTSATVAVALLAVLKVGAEWVFPGRFDPGFWIGIDPIVVFFAGFVVKDEATPVNASTIEYDDTEHA